jgi:hypothetical protein
LLANVRLARREMPRVMVVLRGDAVSEEEVLAAVGFDPAFDPEPATWLTINREGIEAAPSPPGWQRWSS